MNETGRYVLVGGKYYADGEACATIKTVPEDGSHVAATGAGALPAGNYRIVESGAPEGYDASDASVAFTVKAGEVRDLTGDPVTDEVFRGGVQVTKSDKGCRRPRRSRAAATRRRLASTPASTGSSSPSRTARRTRSSLTANGASRARPWPR